MALGDTEKILKALSRHHCFSLWMPTFGMIGIIQTRVKTAALRKVRQWGKGASVQTVISKRWVPSPPLEA